MVVDEIFATIRRLAGQGTPILLVEQNVHRALEVTKRFYALERGTVILEGSAASASDCEALMRAIAV
jgi:branched-chain amino acid transport system ATP-binding protein